MGWFSEVLGAHPRLTETSSHLVVECSTEEERDALLNFDGMEIRGETFRLSRHSKRMTYPEINRWLDEYLRHRDEMHKGLESRGYRAHHLTAEISQPTSAAAAVGFIAQTNKQTNTCTLPPPK